LRRAHHRLKGLAHGALPALRRLLSSPAITIRETSTSLAPRSQHGLGLKDANGVANDKGVVKFRKLEIRPL
jgi:hypothetical protein